MRMGQSDQVRGVKLQMDSSSHVILQKEHASLPYVPIFYPGTTKSVMCAK